MNRNSLISYDEEGVEEELLTVAPAAARKLDEVKLPWLWSLARAEPRLTVRLFDHLPLMRLVSWTRNS